MNTTDILKKTEKLVSKDREDKHGNKIINHENIARLWSAYFQNKYKKQDGHPDKKGSLLIPKELLKKMAEAFQNGETEMNNKNPPQVCIKMDLATWD